MKRFFCFIVCLIMLVPSALADTPARKLEENDPLYTSLYERAMEYAGLFNEALHSEEYLSMMQVPDSLKEELALVQMQDFTQPWGVTIVRADDALHAYWTEDPGSYLDQANLSPALKTLILQKLYESTGAILVGQSGSVTIALSSSLRLSDSFIQPEAMDGPCFAVMQYGGLYAFLVTFTPTANGTVTAIAQFIPSRAADELNLPTE